MPLKKQRIMLWGKSLEEYTKMFALEEPDLQGKILEMGFGPNGFNAAMNAQGRQVVSCSPLYAEEEAKLFPLVDQGFELFQQRLQEQPQRFIWKTFPNKETLLEKRAETKKLFLKDFPEGVKQGRYLAESLPKLSFEDNQFDLVLCANVSFGRDEKDQLDFHIAAIKECCRVAKEVRIFPVLTEQNEISPLVGPIMATLHLAGYGVAIKQVDYELQVGGNAMMCVWSTACEVKS